MTIFVCLENTNNTYHAIFLHTLTTKELIQKLYKIPELIGSNWKFANGSTGASPNHMNGSNSNLNDESNFKVFVNGPNNILITVTDEVLNNFKDESLYALEVNNGSILMKPIKKSD